MIHKELNHVNVVKMHHYFENNLNVYMLLEACPRKVSYVGYRARLSSRPSLFRTVLLSGRGEGDEFRNFHYYFLLCFYVAPTTGIG